MPAEHDPVSSAVMGTLFPTRVLIDLLPVGTRAPIYGMKKLFIQQW